MATEFLMPKLGLTMEEGTITEWFADDGATISAGEPLLRIETDKTETDVEAAATGRLHRLGEIGETFACGDRIGWFLGDDEDAPEGSPAATTATTATTAPKASVRSAHGSMVGFDGRLAAIEFDRTGRGARRLASSSSNTCAY